MTDVTNSPDPAGIHIHVDELVLEGRPDLDPGDARALDRHVADAVLAYVDLPFPEDLR
jgi:hypothetical protein